MELQITKSSRDDAIVSWGRCFCLSFVVSLIALLLVGTVSGAAVARYRSPLVKGDLYGGIQSRAVYVNLGGENDAADFIFNTVGGKLGVPLGNFTSLEFNVAVPGATDEEGAINVNTGKVGQVEGKLNYHVGAYGRFDLHDKRRGRIYLLLGVHATEIKYTPDENLREGGSDGLERKTDNPVGFSGGAGATYNLSSRSRLYLNLLYHGNNLDSDMWVETYELESLTVGWEANF